MDNILCLLSLQHISPLALVLSSPGFLQFQTFPFIGVAAVSVFGHGSSRSMCPVQPKSVDQFEAVRTGTARRDDGHTNGQWTGRKPLHPARFGQQEFWSQKGLAPHDWMDG